MTDTSAPGNITFGGVTVNRIGLGTNRIHDTAEGHELLRQAVGFGINFIDTAHSYAGGDSETAIGNALSPYENGIIIATKGGYGDASPKRLRHEVEESLRRLKIGRVELYQLHRIDPAIPVEETMRVLKGFQDEGLIRHIGLSEVGIEEIERAKKIAPIASVQNEYNLAVRGHDDVVDYCSENGIIFIPWFPLGGLRGDTAIVEKLVGGLAQKYDATPQQIALAWLLKRSPMMLPIPGTISVNHLADNLKAASLKLSDEDYQKLTLK